MIPEKELTEFDYQLLQVVADHKGINLDELSKLLPHQRVVHLRVKLLAASDMKPSTLGGASFPIPDTCYLNCTEDLNNISITDRGTLVLENQRLREEETRIAKNEKRFWNTFPAAAAIAALLKSFWPEITGIAQWLSNLLPTSPPR